MTNETLTNLKRLVSYPEWNTLIEFAKEQIGYDSPIENITSESLHEWIGGRNVVVNLNDLSALLENEEEMKRNGENDNE